MSNSYVTQVVIEGKDGTKAAVASASKGIQSYARTARAANKTVQASSRAARSSIQQIGYQAQDIAVQLQAGQNPFLVLSQQGSQVASIFGPGGAVAGAFIAIAGIIGMNLVPAFFQASESLDDIKTKLEEMGYTLESVAPELAKALQNEESQKAKKAIQDKNKAYDDQQAVVQGLVDKLADLNAMQAEGRGGNVIAQSIGAVEKQLKLAKQEAERLYIALLPPKNDKANPAIFMAEYEKYLKGVEEREKTIADLRRQAESPLAKLQRRTQELVSLESKYGLGKEWLTSMMEREAKAYESTLPKQKEEVKVLREKYETTNAFMVAYAKYLSQQEEGKKLAESLITPLELLQQKTDRYRQLLAAGAISQETFNRAMLAAGEAYGSNFETVENAKSALKEYADAAADLDKQLEDAAMGGIKSIEDGFVNMINGSQSVADSFRNMAKSIVDDLIRIQIQRSITGPLASALDSSGGLGSIFGSFFGGERAAGGPVQSGKAYLVGEKGPELMMPGNSGYIVNNNDLTNNTSEGVTIVQNINVSTGVSQTVRAEIAQLMPQIANASKAAVLDARKRGGSYAAAFGG